MLSAIRKGPGCCVFGYFPCQRDSQVLIIVISNIKGAKLRRVNTQYEIWMLSIPTNKNAFAVGYSLPPEIVRERKSAVL